MSRPIKLREADVRRLLWDPPEFRRGILSHYVVADAPSDVRTWRMSDATRFLHGLPSPHRPYAFEGLATSEAIRLGTWSPTREANNAFTNHFATLNAGLRDYVPEKVFPDLNADAFVRLSRFWPYRNPFHPIETRFGHAEGKAGFQSPVLHLLNAFPVLPDGVTLGFQVVFRRQRYWPGWWKANPWLRFEFAAGRGYDEDAMAEKRHAHATFYMDGRIWEIHQSRATLDLHPSRVLGEALHLWDRDRGNGLRCHELSLWPRYRLLGLLWAVRHRSIHPFPLRRRRAPHLSAEELAALVHPPPAGAKVPFLFQAPVKPLVASAFQRSQQPRLRERAAQAPGAGGGLRAEDVLAALGATPQDEDEREGEA